MKHGIKRGVIKNGLVHWKGHKFPFEHFSKDSLVELSNKCELVEVKFKTIHVMSKDSNGEPIPKGERVKHEQKAIII